MPKTRLNTGSGIVSLSPGIGTSMIVGVRKPSRVGFGPRPRDTGMPSTSTASPGEAPLGSCSRETSLISMLAPRAGTRGNGSFSSSLRNSSRIRCQVAVSLLAESSSTVVSLPLPSRRTRTLASLCAEAGLDRIDFLKIDVEGAEADAIAGMDFARWRPRVVLVEAVAPGSMAETWAAWEPALVAAGYRFAFFDRLNRFYVADEAAELAQRFPPEPAPWDRVRHLWECGRAAERPDHPDHALAAVLQAGLFAALPSLEPGLLERLIGRGLGATGAEPFSAATAGSLLGTAELPRGRTPAPDLPSLLASDELRAALGRIACRYDGGHLED